MVDQKALQRAHDALRGPLHVLFVVEGVLRFLHLALTLGEDDLAAVDHNLGNGSVQNELLDRSEKGEDACETHRRPRAACSKYPMFRSRWWGFR